MEISSDVSSAEGHDQSDEQMDDVMPATSGTEQATGSVDDPPSKPEDLQVSCEETSEGQASRTSGIEQGAGPSFMGPDSKILPISWEKTPEKRASKTSGAKRVDSSSTDTSPEVENSPMSFGKMLGHQATTSESDRMLKETIAKRPTSFYELRDTNDSSDDESDVERDIRPVKFHIGQRRTFSQCDSPEDSSLDFKIYDSEDHSSSELIGGLSGLRLHDAIQQSPEDEPRRPALLREREQTRLMIAGVPAITVEREEVPGEFDPETGERGASAAQVTKDEHADEKEEKSHGLLSPPPRRSRDSISPTKRKAEECGTNPKFIFQDQVPPERYQESSTETPVKKGRLSSEYGPEQGSPGLLSPPVHSSRDSLSPSKRKVEELECDPNAESILQDVVSPGRSQESPTKRPTKKGRLSSEHDPEETSEKGSSTLKVKDDDSDGKKRASPSLLSPPSRGSGDIVSPSKRKAEELDIEPEVSSSDEVSPGRVQEVVSSKRTKLKPPTPVVEDRNVAKCLKESEKKSETE